MNVCSSASRYFPIRLSPNHILWGDPKSTQLFYRGHGTGRGCRHASAGSRVSPGAASCFAALNAAATTSAAAGGAVRRKPFEVACDSARRARLLVQLARQLREGPPDRGTRAVRMAAREASRMFECASHSSSTKVPISTTSSTPSCSAFVWLSSRETLQPRQPRAHAAEQVARISRIDSTAELAALVASSNSDRSTMPDSAEVAHVSAITCIRFRLACALKVIQAQRPWHEAGPRPLRLHSPPLVRAKRSKPARIACRKMNRVQERHWRLPFCVRALLRVARARAAAVLSEEHCTKYRQTDRYRSKQLSQTASPLVVSGAAWQARAGPWRQRTSWRTCIVARARRAEGDPDTHTRARAHARVSNGGPFA